MIAEIISIGDELLIGQTINTNAAFISGALTDIGFDVNWITTVGDDEHNINAALVQAQQRADVIITTGGLGPTHDDITKKVFADYFKTDMVLHKATFNRLQQRFKKRNLVLTESNIAQAMVPTTAKVLENPVGTAPALLFKRENKLFFVLPGVPVEALAIMNDVIVPHLKKINDQIILKRVLHTSGIPESYLFEQLGDIAELEKDAKIAFLPQLGRVDVRVTSRGKFEEQVREKIERVEQFIRNRVSKNIWGTDDETFDEVVAGLLKRQNKTISVAELGTRAAISSLFTRNDKPEEFFIQGLVISSAEHLKSIFNLKQLKSQPENIYSEPGVRWLAEWTRTAMNSDLALAVAFKPQIEKGTFIALSDQDQTIFSEQSYPFPPEIAIKRIESACLHFLYQYLI